MPTEKRVLCVEIGARPKAIYEAWLSSEGHAAMTGGAATVDARVGGAFTAWDGYISGEITALEPHARIAMTWRTSEFGDAPSSKLEVLLEPVDDEDTLLTLVHEEIPEGDGDKYQQGWADYYFDPMLKHFAPKPKRAKRSKAKPSKVEAPAPAASEPTAEAPAATVSEPVPAKKAKTKGAGKVEKKAAKAEKKAVKAEKKAVEKAEKKAKSAEKKAKKKAEKADAAKKPAKKTKKADAAKKPAKKTKKAD